jgi:hypothetical protein
LVGLLTHLLDDEGAADDRDLEGAATTEDGIAVPVGFADGTPDTDCAGAEMSPDWAGDEGTVEADPIDEGPDSTGDEGKLRAPDVAGALGEPVPSFVWEAAFLAHNFPVGVL